ncbi:uncharacterized protein LOC113332736 [Papaver somniferum]|uniref:uncharacterized protein LOC113332736 n=1 Tax=Papaver somniferum TaxID=3469 RepID=UPI000E6F6D79|nr:uncharacterized protein LOC113332736 [Papaver somniferum]
MCPQIVETNPGTIASWTIHPETKEFEGLCIAYRESIDGFNDGCRPIIALAWSLLNSMYGGTVLSATSVNGNNDMYPIAIYICREGRTKEWDKFLSIITPLMKNTKRAITFFHDFSNGIDIAVDQNFQDVKHFHRLCARKFYQDIRIGFDEPESQKKALYAAKSYNLVDHQRNLVKLPELQRRWVEVCGQSSCARHSYDPSARCPQMVNIFSKAFDLWITELKCLPICQFVMGFEAKLIQLFLTRRRNGRLWKDERIFPRASAKLGDQILRKDLYHASLRPIWRRSDHNTLVTNICNRTSRIIHLILKTCECGKWQISCVPCVHAVAVIAQHDQHRPGPPPYEKYVHDYFTCGMYMASYADIIHQSPGITESLQVPDINPPPLKKIRRLS